MPCARVELAGALSVRPPPAPFFPLPPLRPSPPSSNKSEEGFWRNNDLLLLLDDDAGLIRLNANWMADIHDELLD